MIFHSVQESRIFGFPYGRCEIPSDFTGWSQLREEIIGSGFRFIRVKIKNPGGEQLDQIRSLAKQAYLLEILRVYRSPDLKITPFVKEHQGLEMIKIHPGNKQILEAIVRNTYDDIPFGNYTPQHINLLIPPALQLDAIIEYFLENYTGQDPDKVAYVALLENRKPVGCVVSDYFDHGNGDSGTYSYYVGVARDERHQGIQYKIVSFIRFYIAERGYSYLDGSTRLSNLYSARTMEKIGCKCTGYDWVFLLEK